MSSRRTFLNTTVGLSLGSSAATFAQDAPAVNAGECISLDGEWQFRVDASRDWHTVSVPHTWQTAAPTADHYGVAWYQRTFDAPRDWASRTVRIEFEAVFHSAAIWINDRPAGEHLRLGYTAFFVDATPFLRFDRPNTIRVRVDNSFDDAMLPRGKSSDWAHDGGIYRSVRLLITPKVYIDRLEIDADPDFASKKAAVRIRAIVANSGTAAAQGAIALRIVDESTGLAIFDRAGATRFTTPAGTASTVEILAEIDNAKLWHFDHPHLYRAHLALSSGHKMDDTFGVRRIETRQGGFYLNGERVRLMGAERMAGSNPEFGMAEPAQWIEHDHADMQQLNCVYTRVHWQQDRRVLDYCDRHGILIQTEVPTWGPKTFEGMKTEPSQTILDNGLAHLREMIARDRNHPCIFSWGVCNEINGQNPPAYAFAKRLYDEAKRLDPRRLVTYASNSLMKTPEKDVSGLMDYVMWNEYYESWNKGTVEDMARNLDEIHKAFPGKAIVVSEYGYCACTADRPEGDGKRIDVLVDHDRVFRDRDYVAGLIFFCYNDYRTHIGDKGSGVMKQRVHGVVDVYGARKPSYDALRRESSPVKSVEVKGRPGALKVTVQTQETIPSYTLTGYKLRAVVYGFGEIPVERYELPLPDLRPGARATLDVAFQEKSPLRVLFDVLRPAGHSAFNHNWRP